MSTQDHTWIADVEPLELPDGRWTVVRIFANGDRKRVPWSMETQADALRCGRPLVGCQSSGA